MKILTLRTVVVSLVLVLSLAFAVDGISNGRPKQLAEHHGSGLMARVTFPDGTSRTLTLDGFGCSNAICSRVFIEGKNDDGSVGRVWIDGLSAIRDITADSAVFVLKNGTQQRLSLITDFRVAYLQERSAKPEKLDLSKVRSLQMVESAK